MVICGELVCAALLSNIFDKSMKNTENFRLIGDRLREERTRHDLSQSDVAKICGANRATPSTWERGEQTPNAAALAALSDRGLDIQYVITGRRSLTGAAPAPDSESDAVRVPLFSATGSMGNGNDLITEDVLMGDVPVSRHWLALNVPRSRPEALQLVHAYGDSMLGTLNSGDFAIVDTDCQVADIDGVYVLQANGQLFIKRVTRRMDGAHVITSDNPSVRTVDVLDGSQPVRICGRVVYGWNGRRF